MQPGSLFNATPSCCRLLSLQVTRHHPPLVWGRNMADSEPELSTGIAVCRIEPSRAGEPGGPCYLAATFEQPHTAAQAVPRLEEFAEKHLKAKA